MDSDAEALSQAWERAYEFWSYSDLIWGEGEDPQTPSCDRSWIRTVDS